MTREEHNKWTMDIESYQRWVQDRCGDCQTKTAEIVEFLAQVECNQLQYDFVEKFKDLYTCIATYKDKRGPIWWT